MVCGYRLGAHVSASGPITFHPCCEGTLFLWPLVLVARAFTVHRLRLFPGLGHTNSCQGAGDTSNFDHYEEEQIPTSEVNEFEAEFAPF